MDSKCNIKIGDFGLASLSNINRIKTLAPLKPVTDESELIFSRVTGSPLYTAPEQENDTFYNEKTDVYTLGIILFEMLTTFKTAHQKIEQIKNLKEKGLIDKSLWEKYPAECQLILKLTDRVNKHRPFAYDIIEDRVYLAWKEEIGINKMKKKE